MAENTHKFVSYTPRLGKVLKKLVKNPEGARTSPVKTRPSRKQEIVSFPNNQSAAYNGSFAVELTEENKLKVSSGYLNRNGEFLAIEEKDEITPASGMLCLYSTIKDKKWTEPEFKIMEPDADAYPVAEITVDEESKDISIKQFPVTVATIIMAKPCPLINSNQ
jgi:hypothetical protein